MADVVEMLIFFGSVALIACAFSPLGRALADRIRHGITPRALSEPDPAVYEELDRLRTDMAEVQERLDFAERLLAKPTEERQP